MTQSPSIGALAGALAKAQGRIHGAKKDSANPFFKSSYADLASVWDACKIPLAEAEIAVIQYPASEAATVRVTTMLAHSSGEFVTAEVSATAKDASPQSVGSTITYLRRYGLASMVGVYADDDDGEAAQGRQAPARRPPPPVRAAPPVAHVAAPPVEVVAPTDPPQPEEEDVSDERPADQAVRDAIAASATLGQLVLTLPAVKKLPPPLDAEVMDAYRARRDALKAGK